MNILFLNTTMLNIKNIKKVFLKALLLLKVLLPLKSFLPSKPFLSKTSLLNLFLSITVLKIVFLGTTLLHSTSSHAQNEGRWYKVEMLIFKRLGTERGSRELWPQNVRLIYPKNTRHLQARNADNLRLLPQNQHQLGGLNYTLRKNENYKVLYHKAWKQQMLGAQKSPAIIISGGDTVNSSVNSSKELEGYIKIHIARYLHLTTDLWLTGNIPANSIPTNNIPTNSIPTNSIPTNSIPTNSINRFGYGQDERLFKQAKPIGRFPIGFSESSVNNSSSVIAGGEQEAQHLGYNSYSGNYFHRTSSFNKTSNNSSNNAYNNNAYNNNAYNNNAYSNGNKTNSSKPVSVLRERRRMRSKELHYIDHPLMGLLIWITPI